MPQPAHLPTALCGPRVRLRPWTDADLAPFAAMNADAEVMRYLSARLTRAQSDAYAWRVRAHIDRHGFGLWALDVPRLGFAGFVGLSAKVPFDLAVPGTVVEPHEIGWRLARAAWGQGYATEAAVKCANTAIQVHGGAGYVDDHPVERWFRDARVTTLYEGTSQIQKLIIGRAATGINAVVPS